MPETQKQWFVWGRVYTTVELKTLLKLFWGRKKDISMPVSVDQRPNCTFVRADSALHSLQNKLMVANRRNRVNTLPNDRILDQSKLKGFFRRQNECDSKTKILVYEGYKTS